MDFSFVSDDVLRSMLERDKRELDSCLEHGCTKSTMVLSGSIIEAILMDFFLAFPPQQADCRIEKASLGKLLEWARSDEVLLISAETAGIASVVQSYRNLIHPGREYRLGARVNIQSATVAKNLVEIIAGEIGEKYAQKRGFTAEHTIQKVMTDPASQNMFEHIVTTMTSLERERLLRKIPHVCMSDDRTETDIGSLLKLHNLLKPLVQPEVLASEAIRTYEVVRNSQQDKAMRFIRFYRPELNLLPDKERNAVLSYMLGVLESSAPEEIACFRSQRIFYSLEMEASTPTEFLGEVTKIVRHRLEKAISDPDLEFIRAVESMLEYDDRRKIVEWAEHHRGINMPAEWTNVLIEFPF